MSWMIDRYDSVQQIMIQFTSKLIKFSRIIMDGIEISSNSCQTVDIMTGNNDTSFFKSFSSCNVIAAETGSLVDVLMDYHSNKASLCISIQFMIKMGVNLLLSMGCNIIYPITITVNDTLTNTTDKTIVETFFLATKDNDNSDDSSLIMIVKNNFECLNSNLIQSQINSGITSKELIDILSTNNNNQSISQFTRDFSVFVSDINV